MHMIWWSDTRIRLIGEMLFTKKAGEEKKKQHVSLIQTPNSRYQKLDGTAFATCAAMMSNMSCDDAVLGLLVTLVF